MANLKWRGKCRLWNSFSIWREGECEHMSEKRDIGSVANQPFSFQRDYFLVHFVIHFRCITKPHSLSSFPMPYRLKKFRTWRTLSRTEIKAKIKTKAAGLRFFPRSISEDRVEEVFVPLTFHSKKCLTHNKTFFAKAVFVQSRHRVLLLFFFFTRLNTHRYCIINNVEGERYWWSIHSTALRKQFQTPFCYILSGKQLKRAPFFFFFVSWFCITVWDLRFIIKVEVPRWRRRSQSCQNVQSLGMSCGNLIWISAKSSASWFLTYNLSLETHTTTKFYFLISSLRRGLSASVIFLSRCRITCRSRCAEFRIDSLSCVFLFVVCLFFK